MENFEATPKLIETLSREGISLEQFIDKICSFVERNHITKEYDVDEVLDLYMTFGQNDPGYKYVRKKVFERCNTVIDEHEHKDIDRRLSCFNKTTGKEKIELSEEFVIQNIEAYNKTQDKYIEELVTTMLSLGIVYFDDILLFCESLTNNEEDLTSLASLVDMKYKNYGHKKQNMINFAEFYAMEAKSTHHHISTIKNHYPDDWKSDLLHDEMIKETECKYKVERIKPLLKIDLENKNDLVNIDFSSNYIEYDYNKDYSKDNHDPDVETITIFFPEDSEYYGYSWYFDRKLLQTINDDGETLTYRVQLPKDSVIAIFELETIKYITASKLKDEMDKVPEQDDDYEEDEYEEDEEYYLEPEKRTISKPFQDYLDNKGITLDDYINEICDYLQKNNILDSVKICDTIADKKYLPTGATSYDFHEVLIPRIFNKLHIADDKKQN